jgi:hypothetical protein
MQAPLKPYLRRKCDARPGTQTMMVRRILPQMMVLSVFRQIAFGLPTIAPINARM